MLRHRWTLASDGNVLQLCPGTAADIDLDCLRVPHVVQTTNDAQQLRQMLVGNRHIQHNVAYGEMRPAWHYKLVDECIQRIVLSIDDTFCRHGVAKQVRDRAGGYSSKSPTLTEEFAPNDDIRDR